MSDRAQRNLRDVTDADRLSFDRAWRICHDRSFLVPIRSPSASLNVAQVNADAKLNALLGRHAGVALDHSGLDFNRTTHRLDDAAEVDKNAVPGALNDSPMIHRDRGINQIAA